MKLIVGLGNPGEQYKNTRHNVGFLFVDFLASQLDSAAPFKYDKYLQSDVLVLEKNNQEFVFAKPQTFMNKSGEAIHQVALRYKLSVNDLVVVHDDLDIPFGKFHIQVGRGPLLHNGLESIENHLKTKDFTRVRIGVDGRTPERKIDGETYVLQEFTKEQTLQLQQIFSKIISQLL